MLFLDYVNEPQLPPIRVVLATMKYRGCFILWMLLGAVLLQAKETLVVKEWTVEGQVRRALVHVPARLKSDEKKAPVVFIFHGHGGTMQHAAAVFAVEKHWPEALVVYPQGLKTPGQLTDPSGHRPGWQAAAGDHGDRDLKFFDAMLKSLKSDSRADAAQVFAGGHSNGGAFTYLLWAERGEHLTAVAPSSAVFLPRGKRLSPKPVMHFAGKNDPLVKYTWQQRMMDLVLRVNQCGKEGEVWKKDPRAQIYPSEADAPAVFVIHEGGHEWLKDGGALMTAFFKTCQPLKSR